MFQREGTCKYLDIQGRGRGMHRNGQHRGDSQVALLEMMIKLGGGCVGNANMKEQRRESSLKEMDQK